MPSTKNITAVCSVLPGDSRCLALVAAEALGNKISCYYDQTRKIEAIDDTFKDAGKVGLWTKANSVIYFDDLKVTAK